MRTGELCARGRRPPLWEGSAIGLPIGSEAFGALVCKYEDDGIAKQFRDE